MVVALSVHQRTVDITDVPEGVGSEDGDELLYLIGSASFLHQGCQIPNVEVVVVTAVHLLPPDLIWEEVVELFGDLQPLLVVFA